MMLRLLHKIINNFVLRNVEIVLPELFWVWRGCLVNVNVVQEIFRGGGGFFRNGS